MAVPPYYEVRESSFLIFPISHPLEIGYEYTIFQGRQVEGKGGMLSSVYIEKITKHAKNLLCTAYVWVYFPSSYDATRWILYPEKRVCNFIDSYCLQFHKLKLKIFSLSFISLW